MSAVDGQLVTTATINVVYIPEKAGKFKLPQQEIEWFNVNSGLFEKTTLPAEVIDIAPNTNLPEEQTEEKQHLCFLQFPHIIQAKIMSVLCRSRKKRASISSEE